MRKYNNPALSYSTRLIRAVLLVILVPLSAYIALRVWEFLSGQDIETTDSPAGLLLLVGTVTAWIIAIRKLSPPPSAQPENRHR